MRFTIDIEGDVLERSLEGTFERAKPEIAKELLRAAKEVQREWAATVSGGTPLPGMTRKVNDSRYAQAVSDPNALEVSGDGLEVTIAPKDQKQAELIEKGHPQFDMKPSLLARKSAKTVGSSRFVNVPLTVGQRGTRGRSIGQSVKFRRVSTTTPTGKWVQKAVPPNPVVASVQEQAADKVQQIVVRVLSKYV